MPPFVRTPLDAKSSSTPSASASSSSSSRCGIAPPMFPFCLVSARQPLTSRCITNVARSTSMFSSGFRFRSTSALPTGLSSCVVLGAKPASPSLTKNESVNMFSTNCAKLVGFAASCSMDSGVFAARRSFITFTILFIAWSVCCSAVVSSTASGAATGPSASFRLRCAAARTLTCASIGPFMNDAAAAVKKCLCCALPNVFQSKAPVSSAAVKLLSAQSCVKTFTRRITNSLAVCFAAPPSFLDISTPLSANTQ
mmetsp:Transcript_12420/g.41300  ORF Transcript_12420/g.41300 Transcript_12420/m.41300 type:complete len:254 (-) Transcript_12420:62-823(-)